MASKSSVTNPLATSHEDYSVYRWSKGPSEHGCIFDLGSIPMHCKRDVRVPRPS